MAKLLLALALFLLCAAGADAAVVRLKDGRSFTGTIVSATARDLTLATPEGTLHFDADKVASVDYAESSYTAPPAAPQPQPSRAPYEFAPLKNELSLGIGFGIPLSNTSFSGAGGGDVGNGELGAAFLLDYLRRVDHRISAGFEFQYIDRPGNVTFNGVPNAVTEVSGRSEVLLGTAKWSLTDGGIKPYLRAGVGAHHTSTFADAQPQAGFVWATTGTNEVRRVIDGGAWGFASTAGVGLDFELSASSVFSLEAMWTGMEGAKARTTQAGRDLGLEDNKPRLDVITVGTRFGWRF